MDRKSLIALGVALLAAVVVIGGMALWDNGSKGGGGGDQGAYVKVACRDWVKDRLKSPATAKFSSENTTRTGNTYVVSGAVDSQNGFGAMIRNTYKCEAIHDEAGSHLVAIVGLGN